MSFFFGSSGAKVKPQYTGIQLQTSSSVQPIPLAWGMNRLAPNIIWYGDFQSHKQKQKAGKGFGGSVTGYTYSASIILALCQGPINGVSRVFRDKDKTTNYASLGFSLFLGESGQAPWGYLSSKHPDQALSYSGVAYLAAANYDLGQSATTPQHSFEVRSLRYNTGILGNGDADPALVIQDLLTAAEYGAGFSPGVLNLAQLLSSANATTTGDGTYQTYCRARGFSMSPTLSSQETAGNILDRWTELTDTATVWTGYSLKLIPYATEEVIGHGYHFVPNLQAVYNISDDDYIASSGEPPLKVDRSDPADANNSIKINVRNRDNEYNDAPVEWKDQGLIDVYGLRQGNNIDAAEICSMDMGATIVSLIGQRLAYTRNTYNFTLPPSFCLIEPMDILIVRDPLLGDVAVWIDQLEEQEDLSWKVTAREIPPGLAHAAEAQGLSNNPINTAKDPGPVNNPIIFQPPLDMTSGVPQIWAGISGGDNTDFEPLWGGAYIYVSADGISYQQIGSVNSASRMGVLSAALASYASANPDTSHTLSVNLAESNGDLQSVTPAEASREATLSYVDGEFLSFQDAALAGTNLYNLTTLYRGLHGSSATLHPVGSEYLRLDENVFRYDLPADYVGLTLYFKFQSFNIWNGGLQDLADCVEYTYTPSGSLPGVPSGLRTQLGGTTWVGAILTVYCDAVPGADTYTFEFYLPDGVTLQRTIVSSVPSASYTSQEANSDGPSRSYKVRVKASHNGSSGPWSSMITFTNDAPPTVTGVSATGGATTADISFDLITTDADLGGYVIYYNDTSGFNPSEVGIPINNNGYSPQTIYGLPAGTYYAVMAAYDNWTQNPDLLNMSSEVSFTISSGGGGSTPGGGGGGYCVTSDTGILMADDDHTGPGVYIPASKVKVGDWLWTRHETTMAWGAYQVEAIELVPSANLWELTYNGNTIVATLGHKVWLNGNVWIEIQTVGVPKEGTFQVAKITVNDAHTYISNGILSHNIKVAIP